jgi:hypothetical protein
MIFRIFLFVEIFFDMLKIDKIEPG